MEYALDFDGRSGELSSPAAPVDWHPHDRSEMQLAMIGLGRMGGNMVERLMRNGHKLVVFDRSAGRGREVRSDGRDAGRRSRGGRREAAATPRVVWIMVPAGDPVDDTIATLLPLLSPGDIIIDGGNSNFHDYDAPRRRSSPKRGSSSSTRARAAASGASRTATA